MEYNAKTRLGIWVCFLLMLLTLILLSMNALRNGREDNRPVAGSRDEDAIYVGAIPKTETDEPPHTTASTLGTASETTTGTAQTTTQAVPSAPEPKALYYVTLSEGRIVLLDADGNYLATLNEHAEFLPKEDVTRLRAGVALYSEEELSAMRDDLR